MSITNVVNPGLVNVADEAYPAPPPGREKLPRNLGALVPVGDAGFPIVPPGIGNLPLLVPVDVAAQAFTFPQSFGTSIPPSLIPFLPLIDVVVADDALEQLDVTDYVVTQAGSFSTNAPGEETTFETSIAAIVDADTGLAPGTDTLRYRITLADSLVPFGVTFIGREVEVTFASVMPPPPPGEPSVGQTRQIDFWSVNVIFIQRTDATDTFTNNLVVGDRLLFDTARQGFENVSQQTGVTVNVTLPQGLLAPSDPVTFILGRFLGNFLATSGVAVPFVGSGTAAPPFQGTTEVENQTFGRGLPANVFV